MLSAGAKGRSRGCGHVGGSKPYRRGGGDLVQSVFAPPLKGQFAWLGFCLQICAGLLPVAILCNGMFNRKLMAGALLLVCSVAGCAGQPQRVAHEQQDHDAECRRFGAAIDTPTYLDCRVALSALEQLEQASSSPLRSPMWREAGALEVDHDSREEKQREAHSEGRSGKNSCSRIRAGQLIILDCRLGIPLADLLAGLDP